MNARGPTASRQDPLTSHRPSAEHRSLAETPCEVGQSFIVVTMRFPVLMLVAQLAFAQATQTVEALFGAKLMEQVHEIDAHLDGALGVYVIDLNTGRSLSYHGETVFAQASSI